MNLKFSPQRREGTKIAKETKPSDTSSKSFFLCVLCGKLFRPSLACLAKRQFIPSAQALQNPFQLIEIAEFDLDFPRALFVGADRHLRAEAPGRHGLVRALAAGLL